MHETLGAAREHDARTALIDRSSSSGNPRHGQVEREQRMARVPRGVFDREARDPRVRGHRHVHRDVGRIHGIPALEVGVHRHRHGAGDETEVVERLIAGDLPVGPTQRPGHPRAGRGQGLEPELFQRPRAPRVPRVRHHEAPRGVQPVELGDPVLVHVHAIPRYRAGRCTVVRPCGRRRCGVSTGSTSGGWGGLDRVVVSVVDVASGDVSPHGGRACRDQDRCGRCVRVDVLFSTVSGSRQARPAGGGLDRLDRRAGGVVRPPGQLARDSFAAATTCSGVKPNSRNRVLASAEAP